MSDPNIHRPEWDREIPDAPFRSRGMGIARHAGARELGATLFELDPGGASAPYHLHHGNEELLIVLGGEPELTGAMEGKAFPAGSDVAYMETVLRAMQAAAEHDAKA